MQQEGCEVAKVFIDGSAGTTGLRIYERLSERKDIALLMLPEEDIHLLAVWKLCPSSMTTYRSIYVLKICV